jgi:hypothetical protein
VDDPLDLSRVGLGDLTRATAAGLVALPLQAGNQYVRVPEGPDEIDGLAQRLLGEDQHAHVVDGRGRLRPAREPPGQITLGAVEAQEVPGPHDDHGGRRVLDLQARVEQPQRLRFEG